MTSNDENNTTEETSLARLEPNLDVVKRTLATLDESVPKHVAEAVAKSIGEAVAARLFVDPRVEELENELRDLEHKHVRLAQHALNVLAAFQLKVEGDGTIHIAGGFEANDMETAISIVEIARVAEKLECEGSKLVHKSVRDAAAGGIFG